MSYSKLVEISKDACDKMAPLVRSLYSAMNSETSKLKADASVFTIADGLVQHLLTEHLFTSTKFAHVIGEEDTEVKLESRPYSVDKMVVPDEYCDEIDKIVQEVSILASEIDPDQFKNITVFIDPIDGTREFASGLGEQCSICIGFADESGKAVAGLVYRPIANPATFAGGCASESFIVSNLDVAGLPNVNGFLTTNGAISKFVEKLIHELGYQRVPSGGAGNKMLMLLEGKGVAYIQDRGVSRWDTAGAQAVIEAFGGTLSKLTVFEQKKDFENYKYTKSTVNADFEPGVAVLTKYNSYNSALTKQESASAAPVDAFKTYANLCGLIALSSAGIRQKDIIYDAIQRSKAAFPPSYD